MNDEHNNLTAVSRINTILEKVDDLKKYLQIYHDNQLKIAKKSPPRTQKSSQRNSIPKQSNRRKKSAQPQPQTKKPNPPSNRQSQGDAILQHVD